jgi:hypothetical protein
LANREKDTKR